MELTETTTPNKKSVVVWC